MSYIALANITLTSAASSVTFASIPATYRDLILVADAIGTTTNNGGYVGFRLNSDSGNNYTRVYMVGNGSSAISAADSATNYFNGFAFAGSSGSRSNEILQIMDYAQTDKHKTLLERNSVASLYSVANAGRWASTSAVTSIQLTAFINTFAIGSTFALYGIAG